MIARSSIHGRFQPFHNAHLAYAAEAFRRSQHVYIGLTRTFEDVSAVEAISPHRLEPGSNPLTYFQRSEVITSALIGAGYSSERFSIGPFPIEAPERLREFWPVQLPCFTTVVDQWNEDKVGLLKSLGYDVEILHGEWKGKEYLSGTNIRKMIAAGNEDWRSFVPAGARYLIELYCAKAG